ncbi:urease accessory protein UreD [Vibrio nigripulchritudo ATCC 27043]|uniref:urease accessory protein UreD n=1 Tax=Vibrio nigripulchritudo TaxID=28173 RepID=UPI00021C3B74|nr:urease accessory protein UreD [Vibrio nigripulchritudo]EGU56824.1 urease accessory protein UreD [Vibrio nigripulchritudo ATCC 27043]
MTAARDLASSIEANQIESNQIETNKQSGWEARLNLEFSNPSGSAQGGRTVLSKREQRGPLAVQRPLYPEGGICHTYLLHPPGGVVGGDSLSISTQSQTGAHALVTTPGATKFYLSDDRLAKQTLNLKVESGATLEWFPLENIYFSGAIAHLETQINLASDARFMGWEMHSFGRPALNEGFLKGKISGRTQIRVDDSPLLIEGLNLNGMDKRFFNSGLQQCPTMGSLYVFGASPNALELVQGLLHQFEKDRSSESDPITIAVTVVDGLMVVRAISKWTESMMDAFTQVRTMIREQWGLKNNAPRIWAT